MKCISLVMNGSFVLDIFLWGKNFSKWKCRLCGAVRGKKSEDLRVRRIYPLDMMTSTRAKPNSLLPTILLTSASFSSLVRLSPTTSSCARPGGLRVMPSPRESACGCTCLTTWCRIPACGQGWPSATSTPVTAPSCLSSLTLPRSPTSPCHDQRSCYPIRCCATGAPSHMPVTLPHRPSGRASARSSTCPSGHAILTRAAGWPWTSRCIHTLKWEQGTIYVTSGTNWASTDMRREGNVGVNLNETLLGVKWSRFFLS